MKQPEAMRLADALCAAPERSRTSFEAAAELLRLHEANQAMLEALKEIKERIHTSPIYVMYASEVFDSFYQSRLYEAIAKGEQS